MTIDGTPNLATPRPDYRFNVETYSIGGPAYIPRLANREKKRLFFFVSQEYTGQYVSPGAETEYTPTALERQGNFSQSFGNTNGSPVTIKLLDPSNNNAQFMNNTIPGSRINPLGQAMLNFFPLPNYTPTITTQLYVDNFFEQASAVHPRRNDVVRMDTNITSKLTGYFRYEADTDKPSVLYQNVQFSKVNNEGRVGADGSPLPAIAPILDSNPGHGYAGTVTYTITPTLVNEFEVAEDWNSKGYFTTDNYVSENRGLIPGLPALFPVPPPSASGAQGPVNGYENILPTFSFSASGGLPSSMSYAGAPGTASGTYQNFNPIYSYQDNLSTVKGHHALKFGIYIEKNNKVQPASDAYPGAFSFAASTSTPQLNTNSGYALALLGQTSSYSQSNDTVTFNSLYYNIEWYAQDNWKVNRRLTLDLGVRFYHPTPTYDLNGTFVNFEVAQYSKANAMRLYYPACNQAVATGAVNPNTGLKTCTSSSNGEIALDPVTGASVGSGFIGDTVPGTGNYTDGSVLLGSNGAPNYPYTQSWVKVTPRVGFAYDLFGDGKTALRGGFGIFYDRVMGNDVYGLSGLAPTSYKESVSNLNFAQIQALNTGGAPSINSLSLGPNSPGQSYPYPSNLPWDGVRNASIDIQRNLGTNTVIDIGYVWDHSFNQPMTYNLNYLPIGTGWPFTPSNLSPITTGSSSADIGNNFERTAFPGLGNVTGWCWCGTTNYNGLNVSANRKVAQGFAIGLNYTLSKAMGITTDTIAMTGQNGIPTNAQWNYGRLSQDRTHNVVLSYSYDIPGPAKALGVRGLGYITDNWTLSGITEIRSGAPFNIGCSFPSGTPSQTGGTTGTGDISERCGVVGNPYSNIGTNGNGQVYFNANAIQEATINFNGLNHSLLGSPVLGNVGGGAGDLSLPRTTNFDMTLTKTIPLGSEKRVLRIQAQAYNVFNHTEISGIGTSAQYSFTTNQLVNGPTLGYETAANPNRVMAFTARVVF